MKIFFGALFPVTVAALSVVMSPNATATIVSTVPGPIVSFGTTPFSLLSLGVQGSSGSLAYQVTKSSNGSTASYNYSFTVSGTDIGLLSQIEIPLFNANAISSWNLGGNTGAKASILPTGRGQGLAYWGYNAGTTANDKTAFNASNVPDVLLISNLAPTTSLTLGSRVRHFFA